MRNRTNRKTENRGFTLIELLVALAVLVIAAAAFVPALTFAVKANQNNKLKMTANSIAAGVIEEIRALPYENIGTTGGNPAGTIPQTGSISVGGTAYKVATAITWGSAKGSAGDDNVVAFKNIHVTVTAPGAFTGTIEKMDEIHSIATRESEEPVVKNGHIRVTVRDSEELPFTDISTMVNLRNETGTPAADQYLMTDGGAQALFGILEQGKYVVRVKIPDGVIAGPGQFVDAGWIVVRNIEVKDWQVSDVIVYMDSENRFCSLSLRIVDAETGVPLPADTVTGGGSVTLNWKDSYSDINLVENKAVTAADLTDDELSAGFFGPLWASGTYSLAIRGVLGYANYDMELESSERPLLDNGDEWDGTMQSPGQALKVIVPMKAGAASGRLYGEDTKAQFEDASLFENVAASDEGGGMLLLAENAAKANLAPSAEVNASSVAFGSLVQNICDEIDSSYWRAGSKNMPPHQWVRWDFGSGAVIDSIEIIATDDNGQRARPKKFSLQCSDDGDTWEKLLDVGEAPSVSILSYDITSPKSARYYRLYIEEKHQKDGRLTINEVRLFGTVPGYSDAGKRISNGIALSAFTSAPRLKISWQAETQAGTSAEIWTAVSNSGVTPAEASFTKIAASGSFIPGIVEGSDLTGKYLWVMEKLTTDDAANTPKLDWLYIDY